MDQLEHEGGQTAAAGAFVGEAPALVPAGIYRLRFKSWATVNYFDRQPKVVCHFVICTEGAHFGTKVDRWYNVASLIGKPREKGRFKIKWGQDLAREYLSVVPIVRRKDGVALSRLAGFLLEGEIATVTKDRWQRDLHPAIHYSVLKRFWLCGAVSQRT